MSLRLDKVIADKWMDRENVLWWDGKWWTSKSLFALVDDYEKVLRNSRFGAGQRLITLLPNSPALHALSIACWKLGGTLVPLNLQTGKESLLAAVEHSSPSGLIVADTLFDKVESQLATSGVPVTSVALAGSLSPFDSVKRDLSNEDIALLFYTSGTTGNPKAVPLTHENILSDVDQALRLVNVIGDDEIFLNVLPNFHTLGFVVSGILPLICGLKQAIMSSFMPPERVLDTISEARVTAIVAVPTMLHFLVAAAVRADRSFSGINLVISGGDRFPEKLDKRVESVFGVPVLEGYGLTECSPVLAANPNYESRKLGSVGHVFPDIEIRVKGLDGSDLPIDSEGILWVKGPSIAKGYFKDPVNTSQKFVDGWFNTGDVVQIDGSGYVSIKDRASDVIIVSGFNVYPQEVENILASHPRVKEAAVVGCPNSLSGEVVHGCVIPVAGAELKSSELIAFCKKRLAHYKVPRKIRLMKDFPRNSLGKVLRRVLKDLKE